ncbi:MAG: SusC/RagA family TonB-linked outer membrane protein [marine benthic group bacterium]|nr:SusC/RagA family TonB-linked outer membrane protein [Candidatus Carthagonibacter metallireducens]
MPRVRQFLVALAALTIATVAWTTDLAAQETTGTVRGRVADEMLMTGLGDATISVAGQTAFSAAQGFFVVEDVPVGVHTLTANILGYREFETEVTVTAGQTTEVTVLMSIAPLQLDPLVAVGYGELERTTNTGVVTEVPEEVFNTGRVVAAEQLIQGKVAGVQVTEANGGEPGGGISVRIRGGTSINASNEPLYVVDGVPLEVGGGLSAGGNPLNFINPDDITSFTVLKDASATAIYGSRGANGVVLIETMGGRARADRPTLFTYRGNISGSQIYETPDILNYRQFRDVVANQAPEKLDIIGNANNNWYDRVTRTGYGQDHSLSVTGGGEKMDFRVSVGYLNQEGTVERTGFERASFNLGYNQFLFDDRLKLQATFLGSRTEDEFTGGRVLGSATNMAPSQPVFDAGNEFGGYFEWDDPLGTNNPVGELNLVTDMGVTYRGVGNATGEYFIPGIEGLSATGRFGFISTNSERKFFAPSFSKFQTENGAFGTVWRNNPSEFSWLGDAFLTYARNWTNNALNLTGGYSYQQWQFDNPYLEAQQLSSDLLGTEGIPASDFQRVTLNVEENKLASWFGRANYTFLDRYTLTASIRADESSRFGEDNRWGYFPSFAGAWRISEESFMDGDTFSDLRLRASWGKNGNQAFPNYQQYKTYVFGENTAQSQFGDGFVPTIRPSAVDPNIKWEETSSWNIGLDFGFNNNRYWGSIEYYDKTTEDLIFDVIVAGGTNLSNVVTTNVGEMKNKGFELTLNAGFVQAPPEGFSWDANFNFAYNDNELIKINPFAGGSERILAGEAISGGVGSFIQVLEPGQDVNSFFVYEHILGPDGLPIYADTNEDGSINEQDLYVDRNGDGTINQDDRAAYKSPAPDWIMGHTSLMRWGSFDLSFTLLANIGNYVYNNVASSTGFYDQLRDAEAPNNLHTSTLETGFQTPQYFSDYYVENAGFLRMQNIELGYTFGNWLNGVRVYGVVQNAFTITGYSGVDPTASTNGIDNNRYPRTRTFVGGLSVTF